MGEKSFYTFPFTTPRVFEIPQHLHSDSPKMPKARQLALQGHTGAPTAGAQIRGATRSDAFIVRLAFFEWF